MLMSAQRASAARRPICPRQRRSGVYPGLKKLPVDACAIGRRRPRLADTTLRASAARLKTRLTALLGGAPATASGCKLQAVIKKYRPNLFVFLIQCAVPPTNNGSERALRPCALYRKVTNGFHSQWGAQLYGHIRSVIETARGRAIPILEAIQLTRRSLPLTSGP